MKDFIIPDHGTPVRKGAPVSLTRVKRVRGSYRFEDVKG